MPITNPNQIKGLIAHHHVNDIVGIPDGSPVTRWPNRANPRNRLMSGNANSPLNWSIPVNGNTSLSTPTWDNTEQAVEFPYYNGIGTAYILWSKFDAGVLSNGRTFILRCKHTSPSNSIGGWVSQVNGSWQGLHDAINSYVVEQPGVVGGYNTGVVPIRNQYITLGLVQTQSQLYIVLNGAAGSPINVSMLQCDYFFLGGTYYRCNNNFIKEVVVYNRALTQQELSDVHLYMQSPSLTTPSFDPFNAGAKFWWTGGFNVGVGMSDWTDMVSSSKLTLSGTAPTASTVDGVDSLTFSDSTSYSLTSIDFNFISNGYSTVIGVGDITGVSSAQKSIINNRDNTSGSDVYVDGPLLTARSGSVSQGVSWPVLTTKEVFGFTRDSTSIKTIVNNSLSSGVSVTLSQNQKFEIGKNTTTGVDCSSGAKFCDVFVTDYEVTDVELSWFNNYMLNNSRPRVLQSITSPLQVYGCVRWWDAGTNANTNEWFDRVSNDRMFTEGGGNTSPTKTVSTSFSNNISCYKFDSSNDRFVNTDNVSSISSKPYTLVSILRISTSANGERLVGIHGPQYESGGRPAAILIRSTNDASVIGLWEPGSGGQGDASYQIASAYASKKHACLFININDTSNKLYHDTSSVSINNNHAYYTGGYIHAGKNYYNSNMFELYHVLMYRRSLSQTEMQSIIDWFDQSIGVIVVNPKRNYLMCGSYNDGQSYDYWLSPNEPDHDGLRYTGGNQLSRIHVRRLDLLQP